MICIIMYNPHEPNICNELLSSEIYDKNSLENEHLNSPTVPVKNITEIEKPDKKAIITYSDLKLMYLQGESIHDNYIVFEIVVENGNSVGVVLIKNKNPYPIVGNLLEEVKSKLGTEYENLYYYKNQLKKQYLKDMYNMDLITCNLFFQTNIDYSSRWVKVYVEIPQSPMKVGLQEESLRNDHFQLRSSPPNPKMTVGAWNLSTFTHDFNISSTDIDDSSKFQLRSSPPNPKMTVGAWNLSTFNNNVNLSPTNIDDEDSKENI